MAQLPNELYRQILSPLDGATLRACRLAGRSIHQAATELLFRSVSLKIELITISNGHRANQDEDRDPFQDQVDEDCKSRSRSHNSFIQIAKAPHLRPWVREVTVDAKSTAVPYLHDHTLVPHPFLYALPFLQLFTGLKVLKVIFGKRLSAGLHGGPDLNGFGGGGFLPVHQSEPFARLVLDTCLRCLAGQWTGERQVRIQHELLGRHNQKLSTQWPALLATTSSSDTAGPKMEANTLAISNLPVSMQLVMPELMLACKESLTNLQLQFPSGPWDTFHNLPRQAGDRFDYFQNQLPKAWIPPPIAQNLRVLSLYYENYWGWAPKFDFRTINPGVGLPNLRVLSLGCFVFTHEWQVDWIASLGRRSQQPNDGREGGGGLDALYLKDCPIMWEARVHSALDESTTEIPKADGSGEVVRISNAGYPTDESLELPGGDGNGGGNNLGNLIEVSFPLRWSTVLNRWSETMASSSTGSLRVFVMGSGPWGQVNYRSWQRLPVSSTGLLQYVHFDIGLDPEPFIEQDDRRRLMMEDDGLEAYNAARLADYDAYNVLVSTIEERLRRSKEVPWVGKGLTY
ncbi:WD40-repeat-containing domain protein [Apiospora arundinis]